MSIERIDNPFLAKSKKENGGIIRFQAEAAPAFSHARAERNQSKNFVQFSTNLGNVTQTGSSPTQADPLLGALSIYNASPRLLPVLPIGSNSPAQYAGASCLEADGTTALMTDERGAARPYQGVCYLGAYQFDGDYIFAANNEPTL